MNKRVLALAVVMLVSAMLMVVPGGCRRSDTSRSAIKGPMYMCPMHPAIVSDRPGDCPICGMKLVESGRGGKDVADAPKYHCPMHPEIVSGKTGDCPICGMKLVLIETHGSAVSDLPGLPGLAAVSVPEDARRRMGLTLDKVETKDLVRSIRAAARIVTDETRLHRVTTKVEGWVDKLHVSASGQEVKKDDPLLAIYSPQLVTAQQEYLGALQVGGSLVDAARQRLLFWDVSPGQLARLGETRQVEKTITLYAPVSGFVVEKTVLAGQKINIGESLMVLADLSVVWAEADVLESDVSLVSTGMQMEVSLQSRPGRVFSGKVSFVAPSVDSVTRTLRIRMDISNGDFQLRPGMYADASIRCQLGQRLVAPEAAVMRTGERAYVFKDDGKGVLVPVEVKLGVRADGYYEIVEGLARGDSVVTSANFLVDSESSMRAALEAVSKKQP